MAYLIKYLLLITLFVVSIQSNDTLFVEKNGLNLAYINLAEQYCKTSKVENKLCLEKKLNYLDYADSSIAKYLRNSKKHITPFVTAYHNKNIKKSVLLDIEDSDDGISGEWYNEKTIDIFAITPTTYTLSIYADGYTGGAHGYHSVDFKNYNIKTQKKIILDDLFLPGYYKPLHQIALKHYKRTHKLKPEQSLEHDGWFTNKFVLAKTFAITKKGLYFIYNSYEIKPYSAGHTEFMLPYSTLETILDPKGIVGFSLDSK